MPDLDALYSAALLLTRDQREANDLCRETILQAYRSFDDFGAGTNRRAWLLTILRNLCRTRHSRIPDKELTTGAERGTDIETTKSGDTSDNPQASFIQRAAAESIHDALHTLPEESRAAVILVDIGNLSYAEAAKALAVPICTLRLLVSRGRALIRRALAGGPGALKLARPLK